MECLKIRITNLFSQKLWNLDLLCKFLTISHVFIYYNMSIITIYRSCIEDVENNIDQLEQKLDKVQNIIIFWMKVIKDSFLNYAKKLCVFKHKIYTFPFLHWLIFQVLKNCSSMIDAGKNFVGQQRYLWNSFLFTPEFHNNSLRISP